MIMMMVMFDDVNDVDDDFCSLFCYCSLTLLGVACLVGCIFHFNASESKTLFSYASIILFTFILMDAYTLKPTDQTRNQPTNQTTQITCVLFFLLCQ